MVRPKLGHPLSGAVVFWLVLLDPRAPVVPCAEGGRGDLSIAVAQGPRSLKGPRNRASALSGE